MQGDIFAKLFCYFAFPPPLPSLFFSCQLLTYNIKFSEVPKGHIKKRTGVSQVGLTLQIPKMKSVILKSPVQPL